MEEIKGVKFDQDLGNIMTEADHERMFLEQKKLHDSTVDEHQKR